MPHPPPFPIEVDELDAAFLSDALGFDIHHVATERIGADRGMLGEIFRLRATGGDGRSMELAAKFAARREGSLASALRGRNYERELLCYEQLLADTPVRVPGFHGAWYDPATAHFLLLQEMIASDPGVDQTVGLSIDQARRVLTEIAALHGRWMADPGLTTLDWLPRLDSELRLDNLTTLTRLGWERLAAMLGDDLPTLPRGFGEGLPDRIESTMRHVAELPHTLLHCDLRADNLLFDPDDGAVTVVDWQGCGIGPPAFDIAYFLTQSLAVDTRREAEDDLIEHWRAELAGRVDVAATGSADVTAGYPESLWYAMAVACALPVISDPAEPRVRALAHAVATRTIAALDDHGQLDSS